MQHHGHELAFAVQMSLCGCLTHSVGKRALQEPSDFGNGQRFLFLSIDDAFRLHFCQDLFQIFLGDISVRKVDGFHNPVIGCTFCRSRQDSRLFFLFVPPDPLRSTVLCDNGVGFCVCLALLFQFGDAYFAVKVNCLFMRIYIV